MHLNFKSNIYSINLFVNLNLSCPALLIEYITCRCCFKQVEFHPVDILCDRHFPINPNESHQIWFISEKYRCLKLISCFT